MKIQGVGYGHELERAFLSQEEIETMLNKVFVSDRLNQAKDILLFSCFTGLAYANVKKLSRKNIAIGVDGERWIYINRTKTDTRSNIPILPITSYYFTSGKVSSLGCASVRNDTSYDCDGGSYWRLCRQ